MVMRFLAASIVLLTLLVLPFVVPQSRRTASRTAEVISLAKVVPPEAPAAPVAQITFKQVVPQSPDVRQQWNACVALQVVGAAVPSDMRRAVIDAFFEGRLDASASWVRSQLNSFAAADVARLARNARNLDRSIVLMQSAPVGMVRVLVEQADDAEAHADAAKVLSNDLLGLIGDPALGHRAYALLRCAGPVPAEVIESLTGRIASESWARTEVAALGLAAREALVSRLDSSDAPTRAAAAWLLAIAVGDASAERVIRIAVPELRRDGAPMNAHFAVRALVVLGDKSRPIARVLLRSSDDQVVACALDVLMRTGGASDEEVGIATKALDRLAKDSGDESAIGTDVKSALGSLGAKAIKDPPDRLEPSTTKTKSPGREY